MGVCLLFLSFTTSSYAMPSEASNVEQRSVIVCPVNGTAHMSARATFEKYTFTKSGTWYNCSCYTCNCGSEIYITDYNSDYGGNHYYFYPSEVDWYSKLGYSYLVPRNLRAFSGANPPGWAIY